PKHNCLIMCVLSTESFSVVVPETPVSGLFGGSVTLPCALSDNLDARKLEVRWYRPSMYSSPALLYLNEKLDLTSADLKYQGRVSLPGPLEKGEASLKLDDLRSSDIGTYMCHSSELSKNSINANIILSFLAVGSSPILSMLDAGGGKVNVSCRSHGWLPKPTLTWRDREGSSLNPPNETHTSTKGSPILHVCKLIDSSVWTKVCNVRHYICKHIWALHLYMCMFVFVGTWKGAFFGTLILLLLCIIIGVGVGVYFVVLKKGVYYFCSKLNMDMDSGKSII
uniref:Ig-like domain-containing protein n=1 Tax=Astyanax mexicanus TaxID=7994 RepID=A0A8B9M159_ASTMX